MRPPRRPPDFKKGKYRFTETAFTITLLIHLALFIVIFTFGINEKLYNIADNMAMVSECVNGGLLSVCLQLYSFLMLLVIGLAYGKIEPKLRKDH